MALIPVTKRKVIVRKQIEVKFVKKTNRDDPHERIHGLGGVNLLGKKWYLPEDEIIKRIKSGKYTFFTTGDGKRAVIIIAKHKGREYLKTEPDNTPLNNLLRLEEFQL